MNKRTAISCMVAFFAISILIHLPFFQWLDEQILLFVETLRVEWLTNIMLFFTTVGSVKVTRPLTFTVALFLLLKRKNLEMLFILLNFYSIRMFNRLLKNGFERERPSFDPLVEANGYSFPSGHAMNSTAIYGLFLLFWLIHYPSFPYRKQIAVLTASLILFIGLSRVYLGVHYITDVIAGFLIGMIWIYSIIKIYGAFRQKSSKFTKGIPGKKAN